MLPKPNLVLVQKSLPIGSPIATVFGFMSNHENYARWFPGVVAIRSPDDLPHGTVGKIYDETLALPAGRLRTISIQVLESHAPVSFVMQADFAPLHPRTEIRLVEKSADETILNWTFVSRSQSTIGRFLLRALARKPLERRSAAGLRKLKKLLEEESR